MSDESTFVNNAAHFLDYLESGNELRIPNVMRRIRDLLVKRLGDCDDEDWTTFAAVRPMTPAPPVDEAVAEYIDDDEWREEEETFAPSHLVTDDSIVRRFTEAVHDLKATDAPLYVDIQYLEADDGDRVIKEFSAERVGGPTAWIMVKTPEGAVPNWKENKYVKSHINGLDWDYGVIGLEELRQTARGLFGGGRQLYIKGESKINTLVRKLGVPRPNITDLTHLPKLQILRCDISMAEECPYHRKRWWLACAKLHTHAMIEKSQASQNSV